MDDRHTLFKHEKVRVVFAHTRANHNDVKWCGFQRIGPLVRCGLAVKDEPNAGIIALIGSGLPATSRITDRMVERDLLERHRHADYGRIMRVKTTRKGQDPDDLATLYEEINSILLEGFDEEERKVAFDLLIRLEKKRGECIWLVGPIGPRKRKMIAEIQMWIDKNFRGKMAKSRMVLKASSGSTLWGISYHGKIDAAALDGGAQKAVGCWGRCDENSVSVNQLGWFCRQCDGSGQYEV